MQPPPAPLAACGSCVLKLTPFRSAANAAHQSADDDLAEFCMRLQHVAGCRLQLASCKLSSGSSSRSSQAQSFALLLLLQLLLLVLIDFSNKHDTWQTSDSHCTQTTITTITTTSTTIGKFKSSPQEIPIHFRLFLQLSSGCS